LVIKDISTTYRKGHRFKANTVYCPSFYRQLVTLMGCNIDNESTLTSLYITIVMYNQLKLFQRSIQSSSVSKTTLSTNDQWV